MKTVLLIVNTSLAAVKPKMWLNSHADTCVVGENFLIEYDHNRPVNVFGYNPKAGFKQDCIVDAMIAYTEHETGQVFILLIN